MILLPPFFLSPGLVGLMVFFFLIPLRREPLFPFLGALGRFLLFPFFETSFWRSPELFDLFFPPPTPKPSYT